MPETAKARPKIGARTTPGEVRAPFGIEGDAHNREFQVLQVGGGFQSPVPL